MADAHICLGSKSDKRASSNVARFKQVAREVAKRLKLRPSDSHVQHIATLSLGREMLTVEMLDGARVDPTALLKFDDAIRQHMPATEQEPVELVIVRSMICPQCREVRPMTAEEQSQPATEESRGRKTPQIEPTASPSPLKGKSKPKVEPPLHERLAKDSRPDAESKTVSNGGGASLCWWSSTNNRGSL